MDDGRRGPRITPGSGRREHSGPWTACGEDQSDPEDDKFVAAAVEAGADYVVTGDKDLLDIARYRGLRLISPATFLRILREEERA